MNGEVPPEFRNAAPWHKRSKMNVTISVLLVISLLTIFLLITTLVVIISQEDKNDPVCVTTSCIHTASRILNYMDASIDPCNDFYQFACGGYLKNTNIPEDKTHIDSFLTTEDLVKDQSKSIIDEILEEEPKKPYDMIKMIYNICMNTTAMDIEGLPTLKTILSDLGDWPLLKGDNWNEGKFDWWQTMYKLRKLGFSTSTFITFSVGTDGKNSSKRIIELDQATLGLSREFLVRGIEEKIVKEYYNYMVDIATWFGVDRPIAVKEFNKTLELEITLAKISLPRGKHRSVSNLHNPMTVEQLQEKFSFMPWVNYLNKILDVPDIEITEDDIVNVVAPKYLSELKILLRRTPKRVQANYILSKIVLSAVPSLPKQFRDRLDEYTRVNSGRKEAPARWKQCTSRVSDLMPIAMSTLYFRKYFNKDAANHTKEIISNIKNEFLNHLRTNNWMDEDTRNQTITKATSMFSYVGYAYELFNDKLIEKIYSNLELNTHSYLKMELAATLFNTDEKHKLLRVPVYRNNLISANSNKVNAFYSFPRNAIDLPVGILQGVYLDIDGPRYMNYGAIGFIIGHEIIHGFDDCGIQYAENGNIGEWWPEKTKQVFLRKVQCIIEQYGNYYVSEVQLNLNGVAILGEIIADNGGINQAYLAYQAWVKQNGLEHSLPGLSYTPNQLFWMSAASLLCTKYTNEFLKTVVIAGNHPPGKYRIKGSFSNSEYFSKDFQCPLGSEMNPKYKCQIW